MKLQFDSSLDFQHDAINAVCDLFDGQQHAVSPFSVLRHQATPQAQLALVAPDIGYGNQKLITDDELLRNLRRVQIRNGVHVTTTLKPPFDFTVEMETGTGKTYVYLRTILELNARYGFSKFVIVVPSVAIREGVLKTLQITHDHFRELYAAVRYEYFVYDSARLNRVRDFATSETLQVMVTTVAAINKGTNKWNLPSESLGGDSPLNLVQNTRPILIVDEPQSVDGGAAGAGRAALDAMMPLCSLRYSATHKSSHNMVYRLDAVRAYERRLVKRIEVASAEVENAFNKAYVKVESIKANKSGPKAQITIDVLEKTGNVRRQTRTFDGPARLELETGREVYRDFTIGEIRSGADGFVELRGPGIEPEYLHPGKSYGDVEELALHRQMIRRTIQEHFAKEKRLRKRGIKVLSLFFVDEVKNYRQYDADGNIVPGPFAGIFEEEYTQLAKHPDYRDLFESIDLRHPVSLAHNGYFNVDKRSKQFVDTSEGRGSEKEENAEAFRLIMQAKEELLSLDTPLRFIFSHSALREGWDNPNVFQVCILRSMAGQRERRQSIGRGLRLCVDQTGQRVHDESVNILTVTADESYEVFADQLQKEIEDAMDMKFGQLSAKHFAGIITGDGDPPTVLGDDAARRLWEHFVACKYVKTGGDIRDDLRDALARDAVNIPEEFAAVTDQILAIAKRHAGRIEVLDARKRRTIGVNHKMLHSVEFTALWKRIRRRTIFSVEFDPEKLVEEAVRELQQPQYKVKPALIVWRKATLQFDDSGISATAKAGTDQVLLNEADIVLPDVLTHLQDGTQLTRRTLHRIVRESGRINDLKQNPQEFLRLATAAINAAKRRVLIGGISYVPHPDADAYYKQELFELQELTTHLVDTHKSQKAVFEEVVYDSAVERAFASELDNHDRVKVYTKLPSWFVIPTPLGTYNPDWAVVVSSSNGDSLYLVAETKGHDLLDDLREAERAKIACGRKHFEALCLAGGDRPATYEVGESFAGMLAKMEGGV